MYRVAFSLMITLAACTGATTQAPPSPSQQATPVPVLRFADRTPFAISSGYDTGMTAEIRDVAHWQATWQRLHAGMSPVPPVPAVDFTREIVVLVALGTKASGGFGLEIVRAGRLGDTLRVVVHRSEPGAGCGLTAALTQPVDVVRIGSRLSIVRYDATVTVAPPCGDRDE